MKKSISTFFIGLLLTVSYYSFSQPISQTFYGQGLWYSDFQNVNSSSYPTGTFQTQIVNSGVKFMRVGGHGYNFLNDNITTAAESYPKNSLGIWPAGYVQMVDKCRLMGMEPIITLPFTPVQANLNNQISLSDNSQVNSDIAFWAQKAYEIVYELNVVHGRNVKYFIIANEPDNGYSYNYTNAGQIQHYFKDIAVRAKMADKNIQIIGPELASYNSTICNALLTGSNLISDAIPSTYTDVNGTVFNTTALAGKYFLDVFTVHHYSWGGTFPTGASQIIPELRKAGGLAANLGALKSTISTANINQSRTASPIKMGLTEANIEYDNNPSTTSIGVNSFIGGQFWAEMMSIAMEQGVDFFCPWSIREGGGPAMTNIGYIDQSSGAFEKPCYWHYWMMANNFSGTYLPEVSGKLLNTDFKAFAAKDGDHVVVMILSQKVGASNRPFSIQLNGGTSSTAGTFCFNAGISSTPFAGNINDQSTMMLIFDCSGNILKTFNYRDAVEWNSKIAPAIANPGTYNAITAAGSINSCRYTLGFGNDNTGSLSCSVAGLTYAWSGPNGYTSSLQNPANAVYPGVYTVVVSGTSCGNVTRTAILHKKSAIVDAGPDVSICTPTGVKQVGTLQITDPGMQTYQWTNPPGTNLTSVSAAQPNANFTSGVGPKTLLLRAYMAGNTCPAKDYVVITPQYSGSAFTYPSANICANTTIPIAPVFGANSTAGAFTSAPALTSLNPSSGYLVPPFPASGTYVITNAVSNACGSTSANTSITFSSGGVIANAGSDVNIFPNCVATLNGSSSPPATYNWFPQGSSVVVPPGGNPVVVSPGVTTTYIFEADNGTCKSYDDKKVTVLTSPPIQCARAYPIGYPSAICINPNGPGKDYQGNINSDLRLHNDTAWIINDITVHNGATLEFSNTVVVIAPNVKINVQPGGTLLIDRATLQTCDGSKWGGIFVNGNNHSAGQLSVSSSLLTDVNIAITTDKAVDIKILENVFLGGNIGITLDRNKGFNIIGNEFYSFNIGIKTTRTSSGTSYIAKNTFGAVKTAVNFDGDDHSKLIIACNNFDYKDYAIRSNNTVLQNQGSASEGAGNVFTTTSSLTANKLYQTSGNNITYYYDPSNPISSSDMNTPISAAMGDASCAINTRLANVSNNSIVESNAKGFKLFPNPNNGYMSFEYKLDENESGVVGIYDVAGRKVSDYKLNAQSNSLSIQEDTLKEGIYFYYVWINGALAYSNKVIIIK